MRINSNRLLTLISIVTILLLSSFSIIKVDGMKTTILFRADKISVDSTINQEKEKVLLEKKLDSIQSKIENVTIPETEIKAEMVKKNGLLISKIKRLREELSKPKGLTPAQLKRANEDIQQLAYFVQKYCSDFETLNVELKELKKSKVELEELEKSKANH